ncbi:carboxymuconolactone decarboxylase family protein [Dyadobacter sp. CY261]|uniref:carboxymuconolactone decarboxylase family protein n=1 Tax=Dyadobacter sp. CY261 TaxID=2907203 RepID=UPI001F327F60|nr:carboxymuconolactone decarboxylase family protein [Dyadobacter sp. CY261]MCF0072986.1 carboxymuconolactone decarboxylase family protein [Dyadobacter sp. CY261]
MKRVNIEATQPQAYKAMYGLSHYLSTSKLTKTHQELIKIRASQINGCAYCIDMHTTDALKAGETIQRIFLLNAWRETTLFTEEERVILELTEAITFIHKEGVNEELYERAAETFDEEYLAQVIMAIATINTWNRIAISTTLQPPLRA